MSNYKSNRKLDHRYPIIRNRQEVAVPRNQLTLEEREQIIACFRAEAETAFAHAEMLRAETDALIEAGSLQAA